MIIALVRETASCDSWRFEDCNMIVDNAVGYIMTMYKSYSNSLTHYIISNIVQYIIGDPAAAPRSHRSSELRLSGRREHRRKGP